MAVIQVKEEKRMCIFKGSKQSDPKDFQLSLEVRGVNSARLEWRKDASGERVRREAQYLTPASTLLLLGKCPLQALNLRVQLSLKSTQL